MSESRTLQEQIRDKERRCLEIAEETASIGSATLIELDSQGESLAVVQRALPSIEENQRVSVDVRAIHLSAASNLTAADAI